MTDLTVNEVVGAYGSRLHLEWVEGLTGGERPIVAEVSEVITDVDGDDARRQEISSARALVGHLNLIHPNQVQILGLSELEYLANLRSMLKQPAFYQEFIRHNDEALSNMNKIIAIKFQQSCPTPKA